MVTWDDLRAVIEKYSWDGPVHVRGEPWQVVIGCILSQRTRDEVTDAAYTRLFRRFASLEELASAPIEEVEKLIYPVGFYRQKARRIVEAAGWVLKNGVPNTFEGLIKIPGVGRKCANIVLTHAFGVPAIAVDTHVLRIGRRLGLGRTPEEVEEALKKIVPTDFWNSVNLALVRFGREVCRRRPLCDRCPLREACPEGRSTQPL